MQKETPKAVAEILTVLARDGVGVIPTDTTYGLVGSALSQRAVERIYKLKGRESKKPFIILIDDVKDLEKFSIFPDEAARNVLAQVWPGKVTVILPCEKDEFSYLHRGGKSLAFRVPNKVDLRELLRVRGPLVAPSANIEGQPPAESVEEARGYFGGEVDFYQDGGLCQSLPSTIISLSDGVCKVVRSGAGDDLVKKLI